MKILHRYTGATLWEGECDTIREELVAAVKDGADLSGADLYGATLYGANLSSADLGKRRSERRRWILGSRPYAPSASTACVEATRNENFTKAVRG